MKKDNFLERQERVRLTPLPTPLEYAENLSKLLGGPDIYIKRDDFTTLAFGGNKTRKLEFIMADALKKKADVVITIGGLQSNWARQTVSAANKLGMETILILEGEEPEEYQGNLLLDKIMGAEIRYREFTRKEEDQEIWGQCPVTGKVAEELSKQNKTPYVIPLGGATPVGNLGYINAALEIKKQTERNNIRADYIALATGTGGTQAGLELGNRLYDLNSNIVGLSVSRHSRDKEDEIAELCNQTLEYFGIDELIFNRSEIRVNYDYIGDGYAIPTEECIEAIRLVARTEGIILDPVYSGKAMAGVIDLIKKKEIKKGENVIFIHTGGGTVNFAFNNYFG